MKPGFVLHFQGGETRLRWRMTTFQDEWKYSVRQEQSKLRRMKQDNLGRQQRTILDKESNSGEENKALSYKNKEINL